MNGKHMLLGWLIYLLGFLSFPFLFMRIKRTDKPPPESFDMNFKRTGSWKA